MRAKIEAARSNWIRREEAGYVYYVHRTKNVEICPARDGGRGRWIIGGGLFDGVRKRSLYMAMCGRV